MAAAIYRAQTPQARFQTAEPERNREDTNHTQMLNVPMNPTVDVRLSVRDEIPIKRQRT